MIASGFFDAGHGYDEFGLHPPTLAAAVRAGRFWYERYFRVTSHGSEHVPPTGPAILVANHGGVLPLDGMLLCLDLYRQTNGARIPRAIGDHFVPRLPLVSTWFARLGMVSGTRTNLAHLLARGELAVVFPEGVSGPAKPFRDRYALQRWNVGFAELAIRAGAPVIPVAIIGAEESWPVLVRLRALRAFGSPYFPVPMSPLPLPAHVAIHYGAPIAMPTTGADDPEVVRDAADRAYATVAHLIERGLAARRGVFA